jgi:hypothetical protein
MDMKLTYRTVMQRLAELTGPENPPHVQVKALSKIASELSPNNPRHADVMLALNSDTIETTVVPEPLFEPGEHPYAGLLSEGQDAESDEEEESGEADDNPL